MKARGFTLIEIVIAVAISSIVVVFAAMFIGAPLGAYQAHSRRAVLVADASAAWPRMERDLRSALPNSLRWRRNGQFVVLEMLTVADVVRYMAPPSAAFNTAGVFRGVPIPFDSNGVPATSYYLAVNNGADPYATGAMTSAATRIEIDPAAAGENALRVTPAKVFAPLPAQPRIYLVSGPVTYLCDEGQGTLRRYANYSIAALHAARDTPGELAAAGPAGELITQGLTSCNFTWQAPTATVRLTTTRDGDSVTLLHSSYAEYRP